MFGHESEAARFAVEPVDDAHLATIRDLVHEELAQRIPQRAAFTRARRMNGEKRRLFDDSKIRRIL